MNVNEKLSVSLISEKDLEEIKNCLKEITVNLKIQAENNLTETYIDSKKVPKLLSISHRTWQNYRDSGKIPFIQLGQKIWVKRTDIDNFMEKHYISK